MKKRITALVISMLLVFGALTGCKSNDNPAGVKLDPNNPVTITVWHYYNGAQKVAFDSMIKEFNETIGLEEGIFVEGHNQGDVTQLEDSVMASINKKVGSKEIPNIFASYADTAYEIEKKGYLVDLTKYMSEDDIDSYVDSYIEEGRISSNADELKIFPVAKSTEIFMLNKTAWDKFSKATGSKLDELKTKEGLVNISKKYYEWTDSLTPDVKNDGKAFYGRDAMANMFIIGSMQNGDELFKVENQKVTLNINKENMKKIWDFYYVPYVKGYFSSYGKFRSDDVAIGEIASLTGSTTSANYFPDKVDNNGKSSKIETIVLEDPKFKDGKDYAVQQGAGMVVTKGTEQEEYASVVFLKWFTEEERNIDFCGDSGYLPVKKDANNIDTFNKVIKENNINLNDKVKKTMDVAYDTLKNNTLYTNKAFDGGRNARKVLEYNLYDLAIKDRKEVEKALKNGKSLEEATKKYTSTKNFEKWYDSFSKALKDSVK
ncbi:extracellular solute-binding protein [uncultured Anaerofustis sp.]|uniref:extracellular solute-binding protein n=1 Tax=uncultured Anaerofustis sp. TaxID=904996 RepID=UPI0025FC4E04|nr:extracellular solute-binding protein [uncultured Anaerofustis sp.]